MVPTAGQWGREWIGRGMQKTSLEKFWGSIIEKLYRVSPQNGVIIFFSQIQVLLFLSKVLFSEDESLL
jgi:hypothetical protein